MLIPSSIRQPFAVTASLSRRVNANSQLGVRVDAGHDKLIKKGEC